MVGVYGKDFRYGDKNEIYPIAQRSLQQLSNRLLPFGFYRQVVLIFYQQRIVGQEMQEVLGFKHHFVRAYNASLKGTAQGKA